MTLINKPILHKADKGPAWWYFTVICSSCENLALCYAWSTSRQIPLDATVIKMYPDLDQVGDELPDGAKRYLQQAIESRHAPDGALMLAAASVDSMLKEKGYTKGSLYDRIEEAKLAGVLTPEMQAWAHEIRLSANEPRHADNDFIGATAENVEQVLHFARALGEYLFVLPSRVAKWSSTAPLKKAG